MPCYAQSSILHHPTPSYHTRPHYTTCVCESLSHVQLFTIPWTVALQAPLSMEFSRQKYWSGSLLPPPGDLPHPGLNPSLLHCRQILHLSHQEAQTISYVYPNTTLETSDELRMINWTNWGNGLADLWAENENWALRSSANLSKDYPVASYPAKSLKCAFSFQAMWKTTPFDSFLWSRPSMSGYSVTKRQKSALANLIKREFNGRIYGESLRLERKTEQPETMWTGTTRCQSIKN